MRLSHKPRTLREFGPCCGGLQPRPEEQPMKSNLTTLTTLASLLALAASAPALAGVKTLDFETVGSFASIDEYYNGGADSAGNMGPALGVTFGSDAQGLANDALGPYFSNAPSPLGVMFAAGPDATMDVAGSFTGLRFHYSSSEDVSDAVQVWSGLGATGDLLAAFSLTNNAHGNSCTDSPYCHFSLVAADFTRPAYSVSFGGAANVAVFDDISLIPEPGSAALAALALLALGGSGRTRAGRTR
jgi:hypothetical protein